MQWWERMNDRMKRLDMDSGELADRLGEGYDRVAKWTQGKVAEPRGDGIKRIAGALNTTEQWLRFGAPPEDLSVPDQLPAYNGSLAPGVIEIAEEEYVAIPRFNAALSAGPGAILTDEPEPLGYHMVEAQWLRAVTTAKPDRLMIVQVDGDSMEPTLSSGDWVLIDTMQRRLTREGIYALRVFDSVWVKRISLNLREKLVKVLSDNPHYENQELAETEIEAIGRAISVVARRL